MIENDNNNLRYMAPACQKDLVVSVFVIGMCECDEQFTLLNVETLNTALDKQYFFWRGRYRFGLKVTKVLSGSYLAVTDEDIVERDKQFILHKVKKVKLGYIIVRSKA